MKIKISRFSSSFQFFSDKQSRREFSCERWQLPANFFHLLSRQSRRHHKNTSQKTNSNEFQFHSCSQILFIFYCFMWVFLSWWEQMKLLNQTNECVILIFYQKLFEISKFSTFLMLKSTSNTSLLHLRMPSKNFISFTFSLACLKSPVAWLSDTTSCFCLLRINCETTFQLEDRKVFFSIAQRKL